MGFRRRIQDSPKIDLTPMIDVVFLLLIFFMISTTFIEQPGLQIDLPAAGSGRIERKNREIHVYLASNGDIYLERYQASYASIKAHLATYSEAEAAQLTFLLMADKEARHGQVIALMDLAKQAHIGQLAIATEDSVKAEPAGR